MAKRSTTKILVNVWDTLYEALNKRVEAACLRRDSFLQRVIAAELPFLDAEVTVANSDDASRCIAKHLSLLKRKPLTLNLEKATVKRLDEICRDKNIVRDAFFNRLILLLLAPPKLLGVIFDAETLPEDWRDSWEDPGLANRWQVLRTIPDYLDNPFGYIRTVLELAREATGDESYVLYQMYIPEHLFGAKDSGEGPEGPNTLGLNVYLPDVLVPGHPAAQKLHDDLIVNLGMPSTAKS